ncbi:hypothetical protein LCGC14_2812370 [marine sediment metagenome]|uniref:Uncharacterized protein n=1 Tax=marine sediment metagenome TaxID=412755 RepID=A0A0F8YJH3_9ZZZZ
MNFPSTGWAIKTASKHPLTGKASSGFLGEHYFIRRPPLYFGGYHVAVFRTRQQARDAADRVASGYDHATAVRVEVSVVEQN